MGKASIYCIFALFVINANASPWAHRLLRSDDDKEQMIVDAPSAIVDGPSVYSLSFCKEMKKDHIICLEMTKDQMFCKEMKKDQMNLLTDTSHQHAYYVDPYFVVPLS